MQANIQGNDSQGSGSITYRTCYAKASLNGEFHVSVSNLCDLETVQKSFMGMKLSLLP